MWLKWLPWRYVIRRTARAHGFLDPLDVLTKLYRFAEPSEVAAPVELLRAGAVFHARGLINTRAIQHNLDWVWPYWVERQFDPQDESFIPRAFSTTHVNLTHRNWTAVGLPGLDLYPIVDPRGLLTPYWDGWSIDGWMVDDNGAQLTPSKLKSVEQRLEFADDLAVVTTSAHDGLRLTSRVDVIREDDDPVCRSSWRAESDRDCWFIVSLRPYNPEGISFVHDIELEADASGWRVNQHERVLFSQPCERHEISDYSQGDVHALLPIGDNKTRVTCDVGMATAAALYRVEAGRPRELDVRVPLTPHGTETPSRLASRRQLGHRGAKSDKAQTKRAAKTWDEALAGHAQLRVPDEQFQYLYDAALRTLVLHSPGEVYPGPYTYKRFWVRDTAFIVNALLCAGLKDCAERALPELLSRQIHSGYFLSQEGEWDANGEALWTLGQFCRLTGQRPPDEWRGPLTKGGEWILHKRLPDDHAGPQAGLLPAGFSAEHLGLNDYYYWDDFWAVAGLRSAAELLGRLGDSVTAEKFVGGANEMMAAIRRSLEQTASRRRIPGIPAAPQRRMDAGAVGSIVGGYPLQLLPTDDEGLLATTRFLQEQCFVDGGFFQDMIHSGINPYLTLQIAQVLLRAGEPGWFSLVETVAELASPTGQWPEAIHPRTLGGCMGDGQHVWAAAEWVMAMRNAFVREEGDSLILASGIPSRWLESDRPVSLASAPTSWGDVTVTVNRSGENVEITWDGAWRGAPPPMEVRLDGFEPLSLADGSGSVTLEPIAVA